jgi:hypothetical protein
VGALFRALHTPEIHDPETGTEAPDVQLSIEAADFLRKLALSIAFNALRKTSRAGTDSGTDLGTEVDTGIGMNLDTDRDTDSGTGMAYPVVNPRF